MNIITDAEQLRKEVSLSVIRQIVDRLTRTTQALEALMREQTNASSPQAS